MSSPHAFWMMEEMSLEKRESVLDGRNELQPGLNLLRNERTLGAIVCYDRRTVLLRDTSDVDLQVIGVGDQLFACIVQHEIVESNPIAFQFELLAGRNDSFVGRNRLLNLDYHLLRRQKQEEFL